MTPTDDKSKRGNFYSIVVILLQMVHDNLAVFIMSFLVVMFMAYTLHVMHAADVDTETLRWARGLVDRAEDSLISFMSGGVIGAGLAINKMNKAAASPQAVVEDKTKE